MVADLASFHTSVVAKAAASRNVFASLPCALSPSLSSCKVRRSRPVALVKETDLCIGATALDSKLEIGGTALESELDIGATALESELDIGATALEPEERVRERVTGGPTT
ncbi:hypothetical protein RB195_009254 [Necator americanus]|uniref:Uncharacterized protein n=1 Tax=Necator americanus TaxID=51031 RepID=A0ABR1CU72_NECAM